MLVDCISKDRSITDLFVMRTGPGDAFAKARRDRFTQALLFIEETRVIAETASLDEVFDDEVFKDILASLGVGICLDGISEDILFRLDRLRYGRIIIVLDESPEGSSFCARTLALLNRYMHPLLAAGRVYTSSIDDTAGSDGANTVLLLQNLIQFNLAVDGNSPL